MLYRKFHPQTKYLFHAATPKFLLILLRVKLTKKAKFYFSR